MSTENLEALQPGMDPKPTGQNTIALGMDESRTPRIPEELSILPVRGLVVFPGTVLPLNVQRAASLKLLDDTLPRTKVIGLLTQRDETKDDPSPQDLYSVGTAALVLKLVRQSEDNVLVIVQGLRRFSLRKIIATDPFVRAEVDLPESILPPPSKEWEATFRNLRDSAARLFELTPDAPEQARMMILNIENPEQLADFLAPNLNIDFAQKQALLDELDVEKRVRAVQQHISAQLEIAQIQQRLQKDVASQFSDAQRRAYLRSQLKAIQHELGETEGGSEEQAEQLRARLQEANPPEEVMKQAERLRSDSSNISRYENSIRRDTARSSVFSGHPASARPVWVNRSPTRWAASLCGSVLAECVMKQRFAVIAARTSARCRDASFKSCVAAARAILSLCSTRSTKSVRIFAAIRRARCSKCSTRDRTTPLSIVTWMSRLICRRSFSLARQTTSRAYPNLYATGSK
jgi:Lon protease-like protein